MASTGQSYMDQFTISNQGIMDLKELLFLTILQLGSINETVDVMTGVVSGSRLGGVGEMEPVGRPSNGCDPQWRASKIKTVEKKWELSEYEIAETLCYTDIQKTIARFSLNRGTNIADLTGTDYMSIIVEPALKNAMERMVWRMFWMGDKDAENVDDSGIITDGVDIDLFKVCDGLFKRLFDITTSNSSQRVAIAANSATTYAAQRSGLLVDGVASKIFDDLIYGAPVRLRQKSNKTLMITQSLADALTIDIKKNKGSNLQWQAVLDGLGNESSLMTTTVYNGQKLLALPIWDEMIQSFEDNGTSYNKPHRAVFADKLDLKAGVHSSDMLAELQVFFVQKDQKNYMLAKDEFGTLTWEDDLIMFAF